jgi:hypothetical protein
MEEETYWYLEMEFLSIEISNETCNVGARVGKLLEVRWSWKFLVSVSHGAFDLPPDTYRLP